METVKDLVRKNFEHVVELRRHFHMHPELSGQEYETQKRIMAELTALGLKPQKAAKTGVIAELKGAKPGKTVAIRADIDALAITDKIDKPYRSQNQGVCHACGHDGHASMLVGLARIFTEMKDEIAGNVRFLFQPSEEVFPGGAVAMIADGAMDGVDAIIGAHLWQPMPVGTVGCPDAKMMAFPDQFDLIIQGKGGHGSMPQQTIDPLLTGAQVVLALRTIVGANVNPLEPAVLTIGCFQSGDVFNVIPDTAVIKGTVRTFDASARATVFSRIEQITKGICESTGAKYDLKKTFGYPALINNPDVAALVREAAGEALGKENALNIPPVMGAEDFSSYLEKAPGAFMFVGVGNPEQGIIYPQHHPQYDIDERALGYGMETMARTVLKLLAK